MEFLEKVEQCGKWPQQACTAMFFLIPKNVTSEMPIALMPTLRRGWEALRAPEVAKWQQKYRVDWCATWRSSAHCVGSIDGNGKVLWKSESRRSRSRGFGPGLGEGIRARQPSFGLGLGDALQPPMEDLALCGNFEHHRCVQFEGCPAEPLTTITAILPRFEWSCLLLGIVLQDALSEVTKIYPSLPL